MTNNQIPYPRHGIAGYYSVVDLPQRDPLGAAPFSTGWAELDQILKIYPEQFIVTTGMAGSGKSTFLFNLITNLCWVHQKKAWMYIPENERRILPKLEKIFGDQPNGSLFGRFVHTQCFVQSSDYVHYNDEPRTIEWILERAYWAWEKDKIDLVLIDPWNELERARDKDENLTDYIGRCLMRVKMFARQTGCTMFMVAHPTKAAVGRDVLLADIEGSMNWFNKCDNGLVIRREAKETLVISAKVREQPEAGAPGDCRFLVDAVTGRFNEQPGGGQIF
jgi:twinkle protein